MGIFLLEDNNMEGGWRFQNGWSDNSYQNIILLFEILMSSPCIFQWQSFDFLLPNWWLYAVIDLHTVIYPVFHNYFDLFIPYFEIDLDYLFYQFYLDSDFKPNRIWFFQWVKVGQFDQPVQLGFQNTVHLSLFLLDIYYVSIFSFSIIKWLRIWLT